MKNLNCIVLTLLLLLSSIQNCIAIVPSQSSDTGGAISSAFDQYTKCYTNFPNFGSDIPGENTWCIVNNTLIIASAVLGLLIPPQPVVAIGMVELTISTIFAAASAISDRATICRISPDSEDTQPEGYTDDMIDQLLGGNASVDDILDKYNKICVDYQGQKIWLKQNQCEVIAGATFCAFTYMETTGTLVDSTRNVMPINGKDPEYLCVRVSSTCPCAFNLGGGIITPPEYEKDDKGTYKLNGDGTPQIKDQSNYTYKAARHCRALRTTNTSPRSLAAPYTGIIDDVCNTWSGYSKNPVTLSAGVVQCFENTMRNIFEKPMAVSNTGVTLTADQQTKYTNYNNDYTYVQNVVAILTDITNGAVSQLLSITEQVKQLIDNITAINNGTAFTAGPYNTKITALANDSASISLQSKISQSNSNVNDIKRKMLALHDLIASESITINNNIGSISANTKIINDNNLIIIPNTAIINFNNTSINTLNGTINAQNSIMQNCSNFINGLNNSLSCGCGNIPSSTCSLGDYCLSNCINQHQCGNNNCGSSCNGFCHVNDYNNVNLPEYNTAQNRRNTAQNQLNPLQKQNNTLIAQNNPLQTQNDTLTSQNNGLTSQNNTLNDLLRQQQSDYAALQKKLTSEQTTLDNLQSQTSSVTANSYNNLNRVNGDLNLLLNEIDTDRINYVGKSLQASAQKTTLTSFQTLQGQMQGFVLILLVFYVMLIGYKMINGEFSPNITNIIPIFMDFAIVYYFAMGNAWRDYFFNMILSASTGLGEFAMSVTNDYVNDTTKDQCNFMDAFYIPTDSNGNWDQSASCSFHNLSILKNNSHATEDQMKAQAVVGYNQKTKTDIMGCIKGPFINRPNYEAVYKPVMYSSLDNDGVISYHPMNVYCYSKSDSSQRVMAIPIQDPATLKILRIQCPSTGICLDSGCTMEDGYRMSELVSAGFSQADLDRSKVVAGDYGIVSTAIEIWDTMADQPVNIIKSITRSSIQVQTASLKYARTKVLDSVRSSENSLKRNYPVLQLYNGVSRDMSYVGMFDTLDCKVMRYLTYNPNNSDDMLSLKFLSSVLFTGIIGLAVWAIMMSMGFIFISMAGTIVQGYLVSIGAITLLLYISPLVMPCLLFPQTKGYFDSWFGQIKKYATGIPISLLTLGMTIVFTDYIFYGDPNLYGASYNNVFNSNGTVNTSCGANNPEVAPLICLFHLVSSELRPSQCTLGPCVNTGDNFSHYTVLLIIATFKAVILINIITESLGKIESFMNSMLGTSQDVALNGSIFNSNMGMFNQLSARAQSLMTAPMDLASDLKGKAQNSMKTARTAAK